MAENADEKELTKVEHTKGRVRHFVTTRFYYKPALGQIVIRKAGVTRRSKYVRLVNQQLKALKDSPDHPARVCGRKGPKGQPTPWDEFVKCLQEQMDKKIRKVK